MCYISRPKYSSIKTMITIIADGDDTMESEGGGVQLPKDVMGEAAGNGTEVGQTVRHS